ncbi:MAG TPA: hypothetical protein VKQ10_06990 [Spirochaetota bacterium]|nr:hypothetical protein [Spirochaetota bacterium]
MSSTYPGKSVPILAIITAVGILLFWLGFFTIGMAPDNPPPCYFAYEHAFPLPDIVMAFVMIAAGYLMLKKIQVGQSLMLAAAGALTFLGLLDFSFNLQNGIYAISTMDMILNGFINTWCVLFGAFMIGKLK